MDLPGMGWVGSTRTRKRDSTVVRQGGPDGPRGPGVSLGGRGLQEERKPTEGPTESGGGGGLCVFGT